MTAISTSCKVSRGKQTPPPLPSLLIQPLETTDNANLYHHQIHYHYQQRQTRRHPYYNSSHRQPHRQPHLHYPPLPSSLSLLVPQKHPSAPPCPVRHTNVTLQAELFPLANDASIHRNQRTTIVINTFTVAPEQIGE